MYFLQPVATTLALALVFFGSLMFGRPMIARMASDFCPLAPEIAGRPGVVRLFSGLTLLWAIVHLLERGDDLHAPREPADNDVRRGAEHREHGDHSQRDRVDRLVVDPDGARRRPRVRARIRPGLADFGHRFTQHRTRRVRTPRGDLRSWSRDRSLRLGLVPRAGDRHARSDRSATLRSQRPTRRALPAGNNRAASPTSSTCAPMAEATTGRPRTSASSTVRPKPS